MATRSAKIDQKADLIWAIADKLTGVYKPHEYGDVILPLTVIRRFDCILSDTKDAVLQKYDEVKNLPMKDILLRKASKKDFYNTSKYTFERLMDDPDHIEENFREYLNKFSANVRDILEKFKFDGHITTMANKGILYIVLKEYTTDRGNLHPNEISNLEMGYIFEEIIRRFSESHNEDAGQHYTPREVIQLMVNILFYDDNDILSGNNVAKTIYDPACGTGGMLSVAEEYLHSLNASTELVSFGQEINDQTFAICKADMLIKGNNADYIKDGNTLSDDQFAGSTFDYILSNPPFGREWKNEKAKVEEEAKLGFGGRFGAGLPAASDGQRDPLVEYKMAGFEMFDDMTASIQEETIQMLFHVKVEQKVEREEVAKVTGTNKDDSTQRAPKTREAKKVYPNDPCPCGSGKKYKQCCGRKA